MSTSGPRRMSKGQEAAASNWVAVRIDGGPLDGEVFDLDFKPGARIRLHSAAGAAVYDFASDDQHEPIAHYIGPAPPSP